MYEKEHYIKIGSPSDHLYYFFDYDERSYDINMEFQHFHHFYEIHILLDTNANHIIEGTLHQIKLFDIVCLKPYLLHKSEYPKGPPKKRLIIQFQLPKHNVGMLQQQLDEVLSIFSAPLPIYRFDSKYQNHLIELVNNIYQISKSKSNISTLTINNRFLDFLCMLYQHHKYNIYEPNVENSTVSKIYSITSYIHNHYHEELSLDLLSRKFYLSRYYLSRLFKEVTGFTLIDYIQMTRVRNAQQLLLFTDLKITDIAAQCGFTSFSQFNRVFNKWCKTSPRNYKNHANSGDINYNEVPIIYTRD